MRHLFIQNQLNAKRRHIRSMYYLAEYSYVMSNLKLPNRELDDIERPASGKIKHFYPELSW